MNLEEIFLRQKALDEKILQKSNSLRSEKLDSNYRFKLASIALLVELAEFANEIESFKYWKANKKDNSAKIREEFADALHFLVSFANEYKICYNISTKIISDDINIQLIEILKSVVDFFNDLNKEKLTKAFELILGIYQMLGYTEADLLSDYIKVNEKKLKKTWKQLLVLLMPRWWNGRHGRLKIYWRNSCWFESSPGYQSGMKMPTWLG